MTKSQDRSNRRPTAWLEDTRTPATVGVPDREVADGLHLVELTVEPRRGREIVLWIATDPDAATPILGDAPFRLAAVPFLLKTSAGPVAQVLWVVHDPADGEPAPWSGDPDAPIAPWRAWPLWSFLTAVDPHGGDGLAVFIELAEQSHLHVLVSTVDGVVLRWVEVENPLHYAELEPLLEPARELPRERLEDAIAEAAVIFEREELLIAAEERPGRDRHAPLPPSGEGVFIRYVREALLRGADRQVVELGGLAREVDGEGYLASLFARFLRVCPELDTERLAALWRIGELPA